MDGSRFDAVSKTLAAETSRRGLLKVLGAVLTGAIFTAARSEPSEAQLFCPPPRMQCPGGCVNTNTDTKNCGACGHSCATPIGQVAQTFGIGLGAWGQFPGFSSTLFGVCQNGVCMTNCNGQIVNLQMDPNNCGTCGHMCTNGQTCVSGQCQAVCVPNGQPCNFNNPGACCNQACCASSPSPVCCL